MIKLTAAFALSVAILAPAGAQAFYIDTELLRGGLDRDERPLVTMDTVAGLNAGIAGVALRYSDRLGLQDAGSGARGLYLGVASLLGFSAQRANAIVIGHEGAHFHFAGLNGRPNHSFIDDDDGETLSWLDAWGRTFISGSVGGPANSWGDPDDVTTDGLMAANNAGNNWQSDYSERLHRRAFARRDANVFSAMDYFFNATHWLGYALGDKRRGSWSSGAGDVHDLADHLEAEHGIDDAMNEIITWSALSALLSRANWEAIGAMGDYIATGDAGLFDNDFSWNIVNHGYHDSFSVAGMAHKRLADRDMSLSAGIETSVIGESWTEVQFGAYRSFGSASVDAMLTLGRDGSFLEIGAEHRLGETLSLIGTAALILDGKTRRADRLTPDGDTLLRLGISWRF